jgi:uncharacterized membrane-anchored protein YjiN (DUF445 family)
LKEDFLQPEKVQQYAQDIWNSLKKTLIDELNAEQSSLKNYVRKNLAEFSENTHRRKSSAQNRPLDKSYRL